MKRLSLWESRLTVLLPSSCGRQQVASGDAPTPLLRSVVYRDPGEGAGGGPPPGSGVSHENPLEIGNGVLVVALPTATYPRVSPFGDVHQLRLRPNAAS